MKGRTPYVAGVREVLELRTGNSPTDPAGDPLVIATHQLSAARRMFSGQCDGGRDGVITIE